MADSTPKTILLKVNSVTDFYRPTHEATVAAATLPGMICDLASDGQLALAAGTTAQWHRCLVVENEYAVESTTSAIDVAYAQDAWAPYVLPQSGDEAYCFIEDGETIAIGDNLVPGTGTGTLVERTTEDLGHICAVALEAVSPVGSNGRCRVRFI